MVHNNISITDTHRITYLQNSVSGKAKDLIHAYSCDPSYYNTALNEIMSRFGEPSVVVNAFINQLESSKCNNSYNKQSFIAFSSFLKRLVQVFQNLGFQADLQSSTLLRKAKEKIPHNLLLNWTEYTLTENVTTTTLVKFQKLLDVQARVYDKINQENRTSTFTYNKNGNYPAVTAQQSVQEQFKQTTARQSQRNDLDQRKVNHNGSKNEQHFANKHTNCVQCHKPHFVATCSDYHKLSPWRSISNYSKNSLCTKCLGNQHCRDTCPSSKRCQVCNGFHHTTLHNPANQFSRTHAAFTTSNVQQQTKTSGQQNWSSKDDNNSQTRKIRKATQNKITQFKPKRNLRCGNFLEIMIINSHRNVRIWMDFLPAKISMSTKYPVHRKIGLSSYSCCQYPLSKKIKYSTRMLSLTPAVSLRFY